MTQTGKSDAFETQLLGLMRCVLRFSDMEQGLRGFLTEAVSCLSQRLAFVLVRADEASECLMCAAAVPENNHSDEQIAQLLLDYKLADQLYGDQAMTMPVDVEGHRETLQCFPLEDFGYLVLVGQPISTNHVFRHSFDEVVDGLARACIANRTNKQLGEQVRRLELATNAGQIGTWEMNFSSRQLHWDSRMYRLYECEQGDFAGTYEDFVRFVHPEDYASVQDYLRNYVAMGLDEPVEYFLRIITATGVTKKIAGYASLIKERGKVTRMVGVNYDISELETARTQSLYRSQVESLLINLSMKIIRNEAQDLNELHTDALQQVGRFVGVDRAYRFDYDFISGTCSNTHEWCADGIEPEIENLQNVPIEAIPFWITSHRSGLPFYVTSVRDLAAGHALRQILEPQGIQSLVTIPLMEEGQCTGFIGFDSVRQARHWNDVDVSLLKLLAELMVNADIKARHEITIRQATDALVYSRDSAQRLAIEANAASEAKSRFVARVSHEIRTPLHAILGLADLVLALSPSREICNYVSSIRESGVTLLELINDVLDFAKAESEDIDLIHESFSLHDLISKLKHMFMPLADQKKIALDFNVSGDMPDNYSGDELRIRQILNNIISNAIKFTVKGSVTIDVSGRIAEADEQGNECWALLFSVKDSGIGIRDEDLGKLFEPFFQSDDSSRRSFSGTGLGLTIAQMLAQRMGGEIHVKSGTGAGSCFSFEVLMPPGAGARTVKERALFHQNTSLHGKRLLMAEDNRVNQQLVTVYLKDQGLDLIIVNNGQEAIDAFAHTNFDLVLMDCQMPVMDGFEATRKIRQMSGDRAHLPVIAVTASALEGDKQQCLAAGMDDVLTKPFSKSGLLDVLSAWLAPSKNGQHFP